MKKVLLMLRTFLADVLTETCARSDFLRGGGVTSKSLYGHLYGRKLFEKVLNIPNMVHVVWENSEF